MTELLAFGLGVGITILAMLPYLIGQRTNALKRRADKLEAELKKKKMSVPFIMRDAMEDTASFNIRMLMDIRDFLIILENEINQQRELIGQIRNGQYRKDQPAAQRNGRARETYAERRE